MIQKQTGIAEAINYAYYILFTLHSGDELSYRFVR